MSSLYFQAHENKEELKAKLKVSIREKSDAFNSEDREEDKVYTDSLLFCLKDLCFGSGTEKYSCCGG